MIGDGARSEDGAPARARRLVVVSNRLPVRAERDAGGWRIVPGAGGLVTALAPLLRDRGGMWIGWTGTDEDHPEVRAAVEESAEAGYTLRTVPLDAGDVALYYRGFANEVLWPLFHDLAARCVFEPAYWERYRAVNERFAATVARATEPDDFVWVQDYHLLGLAGALRRAGVERDLGLFLHIPFPPPDIFLKLPWRRELVEELLAFDLIGFQTVRDRANFVQCVRALLRDGRVVGRGQVVRLAVGGRMVRVGAFPISIDFREFARGAASSDVAREAWYLHERLPDRTIVLGVDRLDYTKGIPERIRAIELALERHPELHGRVTFVQVAVPSRADVPEYDALKRRIDELVGRVNGRFTRTGWTPIHYLYRSLSRPELLAHYRAAEVALVTPLKDGMNLVAKEYCAADVDRRGALILSEFAGAAPQLARGALLVNPHDVAGVAGAIREAVEMPAGERRERMDAMRAQIRRHDIHRWADTYLMAGIARDLGSFPQDHGQLHPAQVDSLSGEAGAAAGGAGDQ